VCPPNGRSVRLSSDEYCRCVQSPDGWIEQRKNKHKEEFYVTDKFIGRGADSSLISKDGINPTGTFYILYTPEGKYGTNWCRREMSVNEEFVRDVQVVIYDYTGKELNRYRDVTTLKVK